jgi:hypothetical protein
MSEPICFVVSPIGGDGSDARKRADMVLRYVIEPAAQKAGLKAERADASNAPGDITVQLLDDLMSARAVVADLSGLNPNVFYELAVAHSFRKPVVTIADEGTSLPFDVVAQRTIFFDYLKVESIDAAVDRIAKGLEVAMASPGKNSPIARVAEWQPLRHGNATERAIAELSDDMASLRAEVRQNASPETAAPRSGGTFDGPDPMLSKSQIQALPPNAQEVATRLRKLGWRAVSDRGLIVLFQALRGLPRSVEVDSVAIQIEEERLRRAHAQ